MHFLNGWTPAVCSVSLCLWAHVEIHPVGAGEASRDPRHGRRSHDWTGKGHVLGMNHDLS